MDQTNGGAKLYRSCAQDCVGAPYYTTADESVCECACIDDLTCAPTGAPTEVTNPPSAAPTEPTGQPSSAPSEAPTQFYEFKCVTRDSAVNADATCNANEVMTSCGFSTLSSTSTVHQGSYIVNGGQTGEAQYCRAGNGGDDVYAHARCCAFTDQSGDVSCIGYDRGTYETNEGKHTVSCSETSFGQITGCSVYSPTNVDEGAYPNDMDRDDGSFAFDTDYPIDSSSPSCTLKKGSGSGGAKATLSCCKSSDYDMNCVTRWGTWNAVTRLSTVTCSANYEMTGCSVDSDDSVAKYVHYSLFVVSDGIA